MFCSFTVFLCSLFFLADWLALCLVDWLNPTDVQCESLSLIMAISIYVEEEQSRRDEMELQREAEIPAWTACMAAKEDDADCLGTRNASWS